MASGFVIRDGLEADIAACMAIDHGYETDYVWQMQITQPLGSWEVSFKTERLPRTMDVMQQGSAHRLYSTLPAEQCFLVACARGEQDILGYLSMRYEPARRVGWIQDFAVDRPFRRVGLASRLLKIARSWALERDITRLMVETQTKNYPAITLCGNNGFAFCGYNDRYFENQDIALFFGLLLR